MRIGERTGKGVRDAPRDALLTESTPSETRGKAFGFHRSMDTAGAIAGPIVTLVLLRTMLASLNVADQYRSILLLAAIPAVLSVLIVLFVREPARAPAPKQPLRVTFRGIPRPLLTFMAIASLFSFADFSYAFLLLRAGQSNGTTVVILLYVLYNIVYAVHAFPAGILSDRVGRKPVVLVGYLAFIAMTTLLVFSNALAVLVVAFILYGLEYGMAEGTQRALVADFAPPDIKATVLGAYHTSVGAVKLASGLVAGFLFYYVAPTATFAFGAVTATFAAIALSLWRPAPRS
jgi:MFS family permease